MTVLGGMSGCSSSEAHPTAIQDAVDAGMTVVKSFPAGSGLTGWAMAQGNEHTIVYTTADKKILLVGMLLGEEGENLSAQHQEESIPKPDFSALYGERENSTCVTEGPVSNQKNMLYVFVNANCPFCHLTWRALQPYQAAGLQVRWVLVDTLGPTSMPKAIEVLAADDTTAAFRKMEENHGKPWNIAPGLTAQDQPDIAARVRKNNEMLEHFGLRGTPGLIWKDEKGDVQVKAGMPRLSELPGITGLPQQKLDDPALAQFR
jgi:thiol:disulfide interchange protein DsbG